MSLSSLGHPWRLAVACILALYLMADLYVFKGPLHMRLMRGRALAAEVHGQPISRQELAEALREHLWKRNESWEALAPQARRQTRWQVLENLVDARLLRASGSRITLDTESSRAAAKRESERMQRQFADPSEFPRRLAAQHLTPQSLEERIYDAQLDESWIARAIEPFLTKTTPQDVSAWYDEFKETLRIPQAYHAAHIFLTRHGKEKPDRSVEMREIQRQLLSREKTFAQLAKEYSEDDRTKTLGGDLGWFTRARMPADFIAAVQKLPVGRCSDPVQTHLGWHLIIVLERHPSRLPALAEVQDEIAAHLISQRREEAVKKLLAELRSQTPQPVAYHAEVIDSAEPAP